MLCSSQGDLAFCQIDLKLRSPELPTHSFRCIFLPKEVWSTFVSGLYLLQKPLDPTLAFPVGNPPEVDYCVSFQFLTLPKTLPNSVQFFLNFFLLTFVGLIFTVGTLAIGRFLRPYVVKAFFAMVLFFVGCCGDCKKLIVKKRTSWVSSRRSGGAPLSGDGANLAGQADALGRGEASDGQRAQGDPDSSKFLILIFCYSYVS